MYFIIFIIDPDQMPRSAVSDRGIPIMPTPFSPTPILPTLKCYLIFAGHTKIL